MTIENKPLNVVCVWVGPKNKKEYDIEWVRKLYRGVLRNLNMDFKFWVLTDIPEELDDYMHPIRYTGNGSGYWAKIDLFKHFVNQPTLYFDIDVVITGNITEIIRNCIESKKFHMVRAPKTGYANSSIMYWDGNYAWMTMEYNRNPELWRTRFYREAQGNVGDQAFITFNLCEVGGHEYIPMCAWAQDGIIVLGRLFPFLVTTGLHKPDRENMNEEVKELVREHWI